MNTRHRQPDSDLSDLSPPEHSGWGLSFWLALLVHVALIVALSLGISWHHDATPVAMQAELWAAVPSEAAPPSAPTSEPTVEPPTPAQPEVTPPPEPAPLKPLPPPKPAPTPAPSPRPDAKIALEKEQKQKEREKEKKLAQEKHEQELKDKKAKEAKEAEKLAKLKEHAKELAKEQAKEQAKEKAKAEAKAKEEAQKAEAKKAEALRQENLNRMQKLAGANSVSGNANVSGNGAPGNTGQATRSSGPSGSYAGKVKQRVQPHIAFDAKDTPGNPEAEVEVRTAPDGTITLTKLTKSSGVPAWDNAVLRALDKTQTLPRDEDGRVPPSMILVFRPKD